MEILMKEHKKCYWKAKNDTWFAKKYEKKCKKSKKMLKKVLTNEKTCDSLTKVAAREQKQSD